MSTTSGLGGTTAAGGAMTLVGLPATGNYTMSLLVGGFVLLVAGLLFLRSSRLHRTDS
jgi:LPXTG-motif cell wall-anchored protein